MRQKAFDKLVHPLLCSELLDRQVPVADAVLLRHMLSGASGVVDFHGAAKDTDPEQIPEAKIYIKKLTSAQKRHSQN